MHINLENLRKKIYSLQNLERFQTSPRIHHESVLEHSGYVAMIVHKLRDTYIFDELKASRLASFHDYSECEISDIPHPIKRLLPVEVQNKLDELEVEIIARDLDDDIAQSLVEFNDFSTVEGMIVALADAYSVLEYSEKEVLLGNDKYYSNNVIPYTFKRISELELLLKPYLVTELRGSTSHQSGE
jgi:5'-deoxynucleotidase YfbR-like HD superfamily hydrolase